MRPKGAERSSIKYKLQYRKGSALLLNGDVVELWSIQAVIKYRFSETGLGQYSIPRHLDDLPEFLTS